MNFFKGLGKKITQGIKDSEIHYLNPFYLVWDFEFLLKQVKNWGET